MSIKKLHSLTRKIITFGIALLICSLLSGILFAQTGMTSSIYLQNGNMNFSGNLQFNGVNVTLNNNFAILIDMLGTNIEAWYGLNSSFLTSGTDAGAVINTARATFGSLSSGAYGIIALKNATYPLFTGIVLGKGTQLEAESGTVLSVQANINAITIDPTDVEPMTYTVQGLTIQMNGFSGDGIYSVHGAHNSISTEPTFSNLLIQGVASGYTGIWMNDPSGMTWNTVRIQYAGTGVYFGHGNVDSANYGNSIFNFLDLNPTANNAVGLNITGGYLGGNDSLNLADFERLQTYPYGGYWNGTIGVAITNERLISFHDSDIEGMSNTILLNNATEINFYNTFSVAITSASVQNYTYAIRLIGNSFDNLFFGGEYSTWGVPYDDESTTTTANPQFACMKNVLDGGVYLYSIQANNFSSMDLIKNAYGWFTPTGTYVPLTSMYESASWTVYTDGTYTYAESGNNSFISFMDRFANSSNVVDYCVNQLGGTYNSIPIHAGTIFLRMANYNLNGTVTLGRYTQLICEPGTTFNQTTNADAIDIDATGNCPAQWAITHLEIEMNDLNGNGIASAHCSQNSIRSMPTLTDIGIEDVAVGYSGINFGDPSGMNWNSVRIDYYGTGVTFYHGTLDTSNYGNSIIDFLDLDPEGPNSIGLNITASPTTQSSNDSMNLAQFDRLQFVPFGSIWANTTAIEITNDRLMSFYDSDVENAGTAILLNGTNKINFYSTYTTSSQNYTVLMIGNSFANMFYGGTLSSLTTAVAFSDQSTATDSRHNYVGNDISIYPGTVTFTAETDLGKAEIWNNNTSVFSPTKTSGFQNVVNGTWITHSLWTNATSITLQFNGTSEYINSTSYYLEPTVIAQNATMFEVGLCQVNIPQAPINRAKGITPTFNSWGVNPGNATAITDGNWMTSSGIGSSNVSTQGNLIGTVDLNLGAVYTVTVEARVGVYSNTSSVTAYWYAYDGANWNQTSGSGACQRTSTSEGYLDTQTETITAQYIRLAFVTGANSESASIEIFEIQALDFTGANVSPVTAVTVGVPISWTASSGFTG